MPEHISSRAAAVATPVDAVVAAIAPGAQWDEAARIRSRET